MASNNILVEEIEKKLADLKQVKTATNNIKTRMQALSSEQVVNNGGNLNANLKRFLPPKLRPTNVGHINHVSWPFWYSMNFNFGTDPTLTSTTEATASFQVSQEAAFVMTHVYRFADEYSAAGDLGPWTIEFRDRQSSRFFNNGPIPIQAIGTKSLPAWMPTPMLILPNAFMEGIMRTHLDPGVNQATVGEGRHQFTVGGFRIRIEDAPRILGSIFG